MQKEIDGVFRSANEALEKNGYVKFSFVAFDSEMSKLTQFIIHNALGKANLLFLESVVVVFLKELIANAVKANLKRTFFEKTKIDITNQEGYQEGMQRFRSEAVDDLKSFIPEMRTRGYRVTLAIQLTDEKLQFFIQNNAAMTAQELIRVRSRIAKIHEVNSIADIFQQFGDDTEGAGLGLLMNLQLLKTSGIGVHNFNLGSNQKFTQARLTIPIKATPAEHIERIVKAIDAQLDLIPTFPDTVQRIIEQCDSAKSQISDIASEIERDPGLAAGILRLANSSGFPGMKKVSSLQKAATILGTKLIKQMAIAHSARTILDSHAKAYKDFWEHAYKCAFYSRAIAVETGNKKLMENVYLAGLLHDLGKIVLFAVDPKVIHEINGLEVNRSKVNSAVLEEVTLGVSHSEVGAQLAGKWDFAPDLIEMIRHHHFPEASDDDFRTAVSIIHLADGFLNKEKSPNNYVHFDWTAREALGLETPASLEYLHQQVQSEFENAEKSRAS